MDKKVIKAKAEQLHNEVSQYSSVRLSRGSLLIQSGAFATEAEWHKRRSTQAERIVRINERLNMN